jgi:lysophospholipase L1-like esterase
MNHKIFLICAMVILLTTGLSSAALEVDEYTKILIHFNGGDGSAIFTDEMGNAWSTSGGSVQTTSSIYDGDSSGVFVNTSKQYITTNNTTWFYPDTQDFTIEFAAKRNNYNSRENIFGCAPSNGAALQIAMQVYFAADNKIQLGITNGTTSVFLASRSQVNDTNWHNYTIQRESTMLYVFQDGVEIGNTSVASTYSIVNTAPANWSIGRNGGYDGYYTNAYLDEFRYSIGIARYQPNYTKYYAYGDSITAATTTGLPADGSAAYILQMVNTYENNATATHNLDGYGQTSKWGADNIVQHYDYPDYFMIAFGSNDLSVGATPTQVMTNITTIYNYVTQRGSHAIVLIPTLRTDGSGNRNLTNQQNWLKNYTELLDSANIPYVKMYDSIDTTPDNGVPNAANVNYMLGDGIHPNLNGQTAMSSVLWYYMNPTTQNINILASDNSQRVEISELPVNFTSTEANIETSMSVLSNSVTNSINSGYLLFSLIILLIAAVGLMRYLDYM